MSAPSPINGQRILVLSKRQYMSQDLLDDRYGRFRELPLALAASGAQVRGLCLSYRHRPEGPVTDSDGAGSVAWTAMNRHRLAPLGANNYWRELDRIKEAFTPTLVWAGSDVPHAVLGVAAAKRLGAALVIDLYDNFESYPLARVPGVNAALRWVTRRADGITCVSAPLRDFVRERYQFRGPLEVIENAIPTGAFVPGDKQAARKLFGLPADALLIGTAGALSRDRGSDALIAAFKTLATARSDVHLVLAGPHDGSLQIPDDARVHYLGMLPSGRVPALLPALDIAVVCNRDTAFSRYCFPQKLYESLGCGIPVAVAKVGAMAGLLEAFPENLYAPGDADSLAATLRGLCAHPRVPLIPIATWTALGRRLAGFCGAIANG